MNDLTAASHRYCPVCGKHFTFTCHEDEWGYAYGQRLVCSYHCMRQMEREDTNKPRYIHPGAMLYKRLMMGKTYTQIKESGTARQNKLDTTKKVREYIEDWVRINPREAARIKEEAQTQLTQIKRTDVAKMAGVRPCTVRDRGDSIGIFGRKVCGNVYYTPQEADAILKALEVSA